MKENNQITHYVLAVIASIMYGVVAPDDFIFAVIAALLIGLALSGIIILFIKLFNGKTRWSKVFMWTTIIICAMSGAGHLMAKSNGIY